MHSATGCLTLPRSLNGRFSDIEIGPKIQEQWRCQALGEDVSELPGGRHMQNAHMAHGDPIPNEMLINLNMLGVLMLYQV